MTYWVNTLETGVIYLSSTYRFYVLSFYQPPCLRRGGWRVCTSYRGSHSSASPALCLGHWESLSVSLRFRTIFSHGMLDQLFILSRIFESRGRLLDHSTRVLCTWRKRSSRYPLGVLQRYEVSGL